MPKTILTHLDDKYRITIPRDFREAIGLKRGSSLLLSLDESRRVVFLTPIENPQNLYSMRIVLKDRPGALAEAAKRLADFGVDIFFSESRTLTRGSLAEWSLLIDLSGLKVSQKEFVKGISHPPVLEVHLEPLRWEEF